MRGIRIGTSAAPAPDWRSPPGGSALASSPRQILTHSVHNAPAAPRVDTLPATLGFPPTHGLAGRPTRRRDLRQSSDKPALAPAAATLYWRPSVPTGARPVTTPPPSRGAQIARPQSGQTENRPASDRARAPPAPVGPLCGRRHARDHRDRSRARAHRPPDGRYD